MSAQQTDTPRTDASLINICGHTEIVESDFARTLERELTEARKEVSRLERLRDSNFEDIRRCCENGKRKQGIIERFKGIADGLKEYARHAVSCRSENGGECNCGLKQILKELEAMEGK